MANVPSNSLEQFARTAEAVAATTKKLGKAALLGEYLARLDDEDLARAARYFAGHQFAQSDARTTNVGGSSLSEALVLATGIAAESLGPRTRAGATAATLHSKCLLKPSRETNRVSRSLTPNSCWRV